MMCALRTPFAASFLACGIFLACSNEDESQTSDETTDPNSDDASSGGTAPGGDGDGDDTPDDSGGAPGDSMDDGPNLSPACAGLEICGPDGSTNCCKRVEIPGGSFPMGRGEEDACPMGQSCAPHETPENEVVIDSFHLDAFEVTVGRFRRFVESYDDFSIGVGAAAHPAIAGSGWLDDFDALLPPDEQTLRQLLSCDEEASWTNSPGSAEALPINCVNWGVAFAYCASVGGRLPTEAEWEFAAAGGDDNRLYPWGDQEPDETRASFYPGDLHRAGSLDDGIGRYGTFDQAGNVWEWALDWLDTGWYEDQGMMCENCARVSSGTHRVLRGGAYSYEPVTLRATTRSGELPETSAPAVGFRCAYSPN